MKTKISILITIVSSVFFMNTSSYSQELETIGSGVIDFLMTNSKTANKMNGTEVAALGVIENLLKISAHRKHEMNVANAGRSEIIINTTSGSQATMYSDNQGNIYLLFNETIYPISPSLVNQAKNESFNLKIKNSTLPNYNLSKLKEGYKFERHYTGSLTEYFLQKKRESLDEIAIKYNISVNDIYFKKGNGSKLISKNDRDWQFLYSTGLQLCNNGYCTTSGTKIRLFPSFRIFLKVSKFKHEIVTTFTCNWFKDFDGQGLNFEDFHGIKRSFFQYEKILFVMGYTTEHEGKWVIEIYETLSGKTVYNKTGTLKKGTQVITVKKEGEKLPIGVYIYNFKIVCENEKTVTKSENFEILSSKEE